MRIQQNTDVQRNPFQNQDIVRTAAGALLVAIPFVVFFVAAQDIIVTSLGGGEVKE